MWVYCVEMHTRDAELVCLKVRGIRLVHLLCRYDDDDNKSGDYGNCGKAGWELFTNVAITT